MRWEFISVFVLNVAACRTLPDFVNELSVWGALFGIGLAEIRTPVQLSRALLLECVCTLLTFYARIAHVHTCRL